MADTRAAYESMKRLFSSVLTAVTALTVTGKVIVFQGLTLYTATIAQLQARIPSNDGIVSTTDIDLTGVDGNEGLLTGTTPVATIDLGEDLVFTFKVESTGGKFVYGASTIVTPGKKDIALQAGDQITVRGLASGVEVIGVQKASGQSLRPSIPIVRTVARSNVTIATGLNSGDSLNGLTLATDDLVLLVAQTAGAENGLYVVGASPARHEYYNTWDSHIGLVVGVRHNLGGLSGPRTLMFVCTAQPGGTLGSTAITFLPCANDTDAILNFDNEGLTMWDTINAFKVKIKNIDNALSSDQSLWFRLNNALRLIDLLGNLTVSGNVTLPSTDGTLAGNSDSIVPSQKAIKTYVDNLIAGLKWKTSVVAATVANATLSTDFENGDTLDGVTLSTGDRILIKNQSTGSQNGIYTVNASGAPTRATDADSGAELVSAAVWVQKGTENADKAFNCTNDSITLGSTSIVFTDFLSTLGSEKLVNKDQPFGYAGLDVNSFLGPTATGYERENGSIKMTPSFLARISSSVALHNGGYVAIAKSSPSVRVIDTIDGNTRMGAINQDEGPFCNGDELLLVNGSSVPLLLEKDNGGGAIPLTWLFPFEEMTWPVGTAVLFRYDSGENKFTVTPWFTPSEMTFKEISGNVVIEDNYEQYQGQMCYVTAEADIEFNETYIPEGFSCSFTSETNDDVLFVAGSMTLKNKDGHNALDGDGAVASVYRRGGNLYLFGQTKTI